MVLLTHDHHDGNLDPAGRALLPSAGVVVTTTSGAKRLGDFANFAGYILWSIWLLAFATLMWRRFPAGSRVAER